MSQLPNEINFLLCVGSALVPFNVRCYRYILSGSAVATLAVFWLFQRRTLCLDPHSLSESFLGYQAPCEAFTSLTSASSRPTTGQEVLLFSQFIDEQTEAQKG